MKNKGFTLVELLAVIVILAIIMIIAIPSVLSTMTTARRKTFIEYIDKVYQTAENKILSKEMFGDKTSCVLYDITSDLGFDNTGDFKGYIITVKQNSDYKYYITLWDSNFMVYAIEYEGGKNDDKLLDYDSTKTNELSADYLAIIAGCTTYTEEKTKENKTATTPEPIPYTGTMEGENGWIGHYTNGVIDDCYKENPNNFCTGTWMANVGSYSADNYPDQVNACREHKSTECCTSNRTENNPSNLLFALYTTDTKSCGWAGIYADGKWRWYVNLNPGGGLPTSGVTYKVAESEAK